MSDLPELNKKIKEVIFIKAGGNTSKFAEMIGVSQQKISRLFNVDNRTGKYPSPLRSDIIDRILNTFNDINKDWLLSNQSEMIKMQGRSLESNFKLKNGEVVKVENGYMVAEDKTVYPVKDGVTQMDDGLHMVVEFRDLSVAAGPLTRSENGYVPQKTMLVPKEYDKGEYLVVRVDGPSMEDGSFYSIPNGANILIRRYHLEQGERLPIRGNLFVIDSKDGQALKQIIEHNVEEGYIICHSYNPEFNDYKVPMEDILGFYLYRKIVGFRPPVRDIN